MRKTTIQMFLEEIENWKELIQVEKDNGYRLKIIRAKLKRKIKNYVYLIRKSKNNNFRSLFHKPQTQLIFRKAG